jgi:hypothetical protein
LKGFVKERPEREKRQSRYARRCVREFKEKAMSIVESGREVKEVVPFLSDRFVVRGYVFRGSWRSED